MSRMHIARFARVLIDVWVLCLALMASFLIRFDGAPPTEMVERLFFLMPFAVAIEYALLRVAGVHRFSWRHVGLRDAAVILGAVTASSFVLLSLRALAGQLHLTDPSMRVLALPLGTILINYVVAFVGLTGARALRRMLAERLETNRRGDRTNSTPTMLVGAGQAGLLVAKELGQRPDLGLRAVGFLDDDLAKQGSVVHGIPVLGSTRDLAALCAKHGAEQVLITIANAPGQTVRRLARLAEEAEIPTKIVPGIYEIVGGQVNLSRIRDIAIEDLLRRDPVRLDDDAIAHDVRSRVVMVTGAAGSIGSELCRQILRFGPDKLVLVDQSESGLFFMERELTSRARELRLEVAVVPCVADVTHFDRMSAVFDAYRPCLVYHAAAYKHVPMMEQNPCQAVDNNVFGTKVVADLAHRHGAHGFVLVSTDKAVNPTSIMGTSKRVAEMYVQSLSQQSETRFVTVRFGNVLGSVGSVVPIFQQQIEAGGPVTVTHPDMQRYFMTIPEAAQLVVQAGTMGRGGEIFILDMGEPVKILDLARELIRLYGLKQDDDIAIEFTGMRPGEKLFEELSTAAEEASKTAHPKIFIGKNERRSWETVCQGLERLRAAGGDDDRIRRALRRLVPEYQWTPPAGESPTRQPPLPRPAPVPS